MTTLREAAQQALDFIRWSQFVPCQSEPFPQPPSTAPQVEAGLKAALAEPVQEPVAWRTQNATPPGGYVVFQQYPQGVVDLGGVVEPLYTAPPQRPAEPVQEPPEFPPHDDKVHAGAVYWYVGTDGKYYSSNEVKLFMETKNKSLHYEPPKWVLDNFDLIPLYTAPPRRDTLTEDEILSLFRNSGSPVLFARAIEAKHGIT